MHNNHPDVGTSGGDGLASCVVADAVNQLVGEIAQDLERPDDFHVGVRVAGPRVAVVEKAANGMAKEAYGIGDDSAMAAGTDDYHAFSHDSDRIDASLLLLRR